MVDRDQSKTVTRRRLLQTSATASVIAASAGHVTAATPNEITVTVPRLPQQISPQGSPPALLDAIYDRGATYDATESRYEPWLFDDWSYANVENTLTATVRDGATWSDGTRVTAGDAAFSALRLQASQDIGLHDATTDGDHTVVYHLDARDGTWLDEILASRVIPRHVWQGSSRIETTTVDEAVGSGPFELISFTPGSKAVLKRRPTDQYPKRSGFGGSEDPRYAEKVVLQAAVPSSNDLGSGVTLATGFDTNPDTQPADGVGTTVTTPSRNTGRVLINCRRNPLDDPVFRRFLWRLWDARKHVSQFDEAVNPLRGNLLAPPHYAGIRSFGQNSTKANRYPRFEGAGGGLAVIDARNWLSSESGENVYWFDKHGYDGSADGKMLYVDGVPFDHVHRGANSSHELEIAIPHSFHPKETLRQFASDLRRVGIPATVSEMPLSTLWTDYLQHRTYDLAALRFAADPLLTHLETTVEASADGSDDSLTGYPGARSILQQDASTPERRREVLRSAQDVIYDDAPVIVTDYTHHVSAAEAGWTGWSKQDVGAANVRTYAGLRPKNVHQTTAATTSTAASESAGSDSATTNSPPAPRTHTGSPLETITNLPPSRLLIAGGIGAGVLAIFGTLYTYSLRGEDDPWDQPAMDDDAAGSDAANDETKTDDGTPTVADENEPTGDDGIEEDGDTGSADESGGFAATSTGESEPESGTDEWSDESGRDADPHNANNVGAVGGDATSEPNDRERAIVERLPGARFASAADNRPLATYRVSFAGDSEPVTVLAADRGLDDETLTACESRVREWESLGSHPNVAAVDDWGTDPFLWVRLEDKYETFDTADDFAIEDRLRVLEGVADAVRNAGLYNVNASTLTPSDVAFPEPGDPSPEVLDWGLTRLASGPEATPYDAPEQRNTDERVESRACDIYRVGAVAYRILTGSPPDTGGNGHGDLTPPSEIADLPAAVDEPIERAMASDPDDRYSSTHHFKMDVLDAF